MSKSSEPNPPTPSRREALKYTTLGTITVTAGVAFWGYGNALRPLQNAASRGSRPDEYIDLTSIDEGKTINYRIHNRAFDIRHLSDAEITQLHSVDTATLPDPISRNANLAADAPADAKNRLLAQRFVLVEATCPDASCAMQTNAGDFGGWLCECSGSHYDPLGRLRKTDSTGSDAQNLTIPKSHWDQTASELLVIG